MVEGVPRRKKFDASAQLKVKLRTLDLDLLRTIGSDPGK